jgi:diketogulonate reductase-like aldo/keto reductase
MAPLARRAFLRGTLAALASVRALGARPAQAATMHTRPIPRTGEALPVIGLGTWQTFDVGATGPERAPLAAVLRHFLDGGARVVDSSPMYGRAEAVTGDLLDELHAHERAFVATKVWTSGKQAGIEQMERSFRLLRTRRIDLLQIHNLVDWKTHLPTLREWKQAGRIRYLGVSHYALGAFDELEQILRTQSVDFVQLPYSVQTRAAEARLLPAARDTGTAVLVMRPFEEGALFRLVRGKPLPPWAADVDCTSWAQLLLKFILAHPAVNAPIPATARVDHLADNLQAGRGRLPDEATRKRLIAHLGL